MKNNYDKETLTSQIKDWWWKNFGWKIKNIIGGIKNIIRWIPIIYRDKDWDHNFIFIILKEKIKNTSAYHTDRQRYIGWENNVKYMNLCVKLIDRIKEGYYEHQAYEYLLHKYGKSECIFTPVPDKEGYSSMTIKYENIENNKYTQAEYDKDFKYYYELASTKHTKSKKLLFKILDEKIESWWD